MNENTENQIDKLKEDCKFEIIRIEDEVNNSKQITNETLATIYETINQFKEWAIITNDELKISEKLGVLKDELFLLCDQAIIEIMKVRNDEKMKTKFEEGKEKIVKVSSDVFNTIGDGIENVMNNDTVQNAVHTAGEKFEQVKNDERVKKGVKNFKIGTLKVATSAFNGLKKALETNDNEEKTEKEEIISIEDK